MHQAQKMYEGRASFDFHEGTRWGSGFQSDGFRVTVAGHVIAECEDSEVADFICKAWNAQAEPRTMRQVADGFDAFATAHENFSSFGIPAQPHHKEREEQGE